MLDSYTELVPTSGPSDLIDLSLDVYCVLRNSFCMLVLWPPFPRLYFLIFLLIQLRAPALNQSWCYIWWKCPGRIIMCLVPAQMDLPCKLSLSLCCQMISMFRILVAIISMEGCEDSIFGWETRQTAAREVSWVRVWLREGRWAAGPLGGKRRVQDVGEGA